MKPESDPGIEHEPHLRGGAFEPDPSEKTARAGGEDSEEGRVEHTVWDEPAFSSELAGAPPNTALTYARWLDQRRSAMTGGRSWGLTLLIALAAGPWAVLGALLQGGGGAVGLLSLVVFGPVVEEMMKVAAPLWVVEKRPFWFRSRFQIAVCALAGGLCFAVIENLLYLHVYFPQASVALSQWRWSVCTALHVGCSLIAGLGVMRVWSVAVLRRERPRPSAATPYLVAAMAVHGAYNAFAVVANDLFR